jgi:hypothetical protein
MGLGISLPYSQQPAIVYYPDQNHISPCRNPPRWISSLILLPHLRLSLPSGLSFIFPHQNLVRTSHSPIRVTNLAHLTIFYHLVIFGEYYCEKISCNGLYICTLHLTVIWDKENSSHSLPYFWLWWYFLTFVTTLDKFFIAVVIKIMTSMCDARAIFVGFMLKNLKNRICFLWLFQLPL